MGILAGVMAPHPPLILPDIGRGQEKKIQKTIDAYNETARRIGSIKPDTIVLCTPHQVMYSDYFHISPGMGARGDFAQFRAGHVKIEVSYDREFVETLCSMPEVRNLPAGTEGERSRELDHGTMVPLYFVNQCFKDYKLVRVGLSGLPLIKHYELGELIGEAAQKLGRRVVFIASGDLSHRLKAEGPYGYQKEGPEYDSRLMEVMEKGAFGELLDFPEDFCEKAGECGHRSFTIMAGALDKKEVQAQMLSYEGTFGVGYGICVYQVRGEGPERNFKERYEERVRSRVLQQRKQEDAYVRLARQTIETFVRTGEKIKLPKETPEELCNRRAGVFVSIKEDGRLKGCMGTICAVESSIGEEIICNAISAASRDYRFTPIESGELDKLTISVDVLGDTEKIDTPKKLDVKRYGVIVTRGRKRGLLLPNLEGVDTVEDQIAIAKRKAGIREDEMVQLERFEVVRHF